MKRKILIKVIVILLVSGIHSYSSAQSKMIISINGKESDIFGYSLEPSTGTPKEISMFGPMQNAGTVFQAALLTANLITGITISITDANTGTSTISLTGVKVETLKQYLSTYSNGSFTISAGGNVNTEVKCQFNKIELTNGSSENTNNKTSTLNNVDNKKTASNGSWELNPNGLKGAAGRILVNLPADLPVLIGFYDTNDKYLSSEDKSLPVSFPPGGYNIQISSVKLINVPVQKGMDTKIYAGTLNVVTLSAWQVFDDTKKKYYHGGSTPEKVGLPAGNYQLLVNGIFQPVVVKNGETTDF